MTRSRALIVLHVESDSGPQRSLAPRLERLRAAGWELTFLVPAPGPAAEVAGELGAVLTGVPGALTLPSSPAEYLGRLRGQRGQARFVERAVRETGSELVVVSAPVMLGALAGARRAEAATLLYCGEVLDRGGLRGLAGAAVARLASDRADSLLVPSRRVARRYERRRAVRVVPPPILPAPAADELARRGGALRAELGVADGEPLVASLGAITEGRGQRVLVEALALSQARGREWALAIGGEAYDRARDRAYERRVRRRVTDLGLGERVRFAGRVADPYALYAAADVFVNPATVPEGFGRAACEALACRCAVVSTRVGGVEEALRDGETALLVEPGSPAALADAIDRLLGDRDLAARLAAAGAADVARRFAPEVGQRAFEQAVTEALAARSNA